MVQNECDAKKPETWELDDEQDCREKRSTPVFLLGVLAVLWILNYIFFWVIEHWWQSLIAIAIAAPLLFLLPWWKVSVTALAILAVYIIAKKRQSGEK